MYVHRSYDVESMVKLRFKVRGIEVECEGSVEEIDKIISGLIGGNYEEVSLEREEVSIKEKIPTQETLINYIVSKPNFEHNIFEIQDHFFGRRFGSHGPDAKKYNALYRRLVRVRGKIEKEHGGKFLSEWDQTPEGELYKIFRFTKDREEKGEN